MPERVPSEMNSSNSICSICHTTSPDFLRSSSGSDGAPLRPCRRLRQLCRAFRRPFLILYLYAVLLNLPLITQRLTNDLDGLWNQDDYISGVWELSLGRWFIPVLDRLRFDLSLDPLPALVSLAVYVLAFLLILDALGLSFRPLTCIKGFLFLSSVGITCQLSLSFTSISYAVSFLLAVLAPWLPVHALRLHRGQNCGQNRGQIRGGGILFSPGSVLASALSICLMMGIYQAGIGSTCLLSLFLLLYSLAEEAADRSVDTADPRRPQRERLSFVLQMLASVVLGGVLYIAVMKASLRITGTTASDYQGLSGISPRYLLEQLPAAVTHGYAAVRHYFLDGTFCSSRLIGSRAVLLLYLLLLPGILRTFRSILRGRKAGAIGRGLLFAAGLLLSPIAANCYYLAAPDTETHMQMTVSMGLLLPLLAGLAARPLCLAPKPAADSAALSRPAEGPQRATVRATGRRFSCRRLCTGLAVSGVVLILYGSALQCITDQYAMLTGRRATQTLAEGILTQAALQGYDLLNGQLLITDSPHSSRTFRTSPLYDKANSYAQYGNWSHDLSFSRVSWRSFFSNYLRTEVSFAAGDTETTIAALPEVAAMPSYPAAGSVQNIYGVLVVKLGE